MSLRPNAVKIERQTPWVMFFCCLKIKSRLLSFIREYGDFYDFFCPAAFRGFALTGRRRKTGFSLISLSLRFFWFFNNSILTARGYPFLIDSNLELIAEIFFFFGNRFSFFFWFSVFSTKVVRVFLVGKPFHSTTSAATLFFGGFSCGLAI